MNLYLYVLDASFNRIAFVDGEDSTVWATRFSECGEFEIRMPWSSSAALYLNSGEYIENDTGYANTVMVIEDREIDTTVEDVPVAIFKGRSIESVLSRRIVWGKHSYSGKIQDIIRTLITDAFISPRSGLEDRRVDNFEFVDNYYDARLEFCEIPEDSPVEFYGDSVYDAIKYLCDLFDVGFRLYLNPEKHLCFELYCGQILDGTGPRELVVEFSPKMENLSNTRYFTSTQNEKNTVRIDSSYTFKAEQDKDDPDFEAEQTNDSTSAVAASITKSSSGDSFVLVSGVVVSVKFHKTLSAGATLNVGGTGSKPLYFKGEALKADTVKSSTKKVTYQVVNGNGRWVVDLSSYAVTAHTPSWMVFPHNGEPLTDNLRLMVKFNKKVEAGATLDINDTGPKPLYYNKAPIGEEYIDSSATLIVHYNTYGGGRWVIESLTETEEEIIQTRAMLVKNADTSGLARREIFTDAGSVPTEDGMTDEDYANYMRMIGYDTLNENAYVVEIDGESIPDINYVYGDHYFLGDIVKVVNECGISSSARIVEYTLTRDENGESACPSFASINTHAQTPSSNDWTE